jgi:hypothetical protein
MASIAVHETMQPAGSTRPQIGSLTSKKLATRERGIVCQRDLEANSRLR